MNGIMDDTVQIEIKVVTWWTVLLLLDILQDHGVATCQPPEKLRNSHCPLFLENFGYVIKVSV